MRWTPLVQEIMPQMLEIIADHDVITRHDIAARLGCSVPTVSRCARALRELGCIETVYGHHKGYRARVPARLRSVTLGELLDHGCLRGHVLLAALELEGGS